MDTRRSDRLSLVEEEHIPNVSEQGSTMKYEEGAADLPDLQHMQQLGADDVQQAQQLQLQHPQQPLRKCEFCRKPVLPQKQMQSCARRDGVVHAACAESERRYEEKRTEAERTSSMSRGVEEQHECVICQRVQFVRREERGIPSMGGGGGGSGGIVLRENTRWIKPCFCDVYAHHGCLAGVVEQRRICPQCGERYSFKVYGSIVDFLSRYWLSYCFISSIVGLFCLVSIYAMVNVIIYPVETWPTGRIVLLVVGLFLSSVAMCCLCSCLRYTFGFRIPRFKSKYRFVRVSNYSPPDSRESSKRTASLLVSQAPRKSSTMSRNLLSFSMSGEETLHSGGSHEYQYTSTPKVGSAGIPLEFSFRSNQIQSPKSFRKLEEHPLRLTLERVLEEDESTISYDDTPKEIRNQ